MRKKFIIANWKMNMDSSAVKNWLMDFDGIVGDKELSSIVVLAPSAIHIPLLMGFASKRDSVELAVQTVSLYDKGAHTGSLGAFQAKDYCKFVIIGHSELNEHKDTVMRKASLVISQKLVPIICFRDEAKLDEYYIQNSILAWEDPENISKGGEFKPKDTGEIETVITGMKARKPEALIVYGGSVNRQNAGELGNITGLDGVLVGSASLEPGHFFEIIQAFEDK